jgi:hypothetical protein
MRPQYVHIPVAMMNYTSMLMAIRVPKHSRNISGDHWVYYSTIGNRSENQAHHHVT